MTVARIMQLAQDRTPLPLEVKPETRLIDLGLDSLEFLEFLSECGIDKELLPQLETIGDVARYAA